LNFFHETKPNCSYLKRIFNPHFEAYKSSATLINVHSSLSLELEKLQILHPSNETAMDLFYVQNKCFSLTFFHRNRKIERVLKIMQPSFLAILSYTVILQMIFVCMNFDDVLEASEGFGACATASLGLTKMVTFYMFMERFYEFMEKLDELSNQGLISLNM
jgi:uncharacterized membrane protein YjgN (DUF898 family)